MSQAARSRMKYRAGLERLVQGQTDPDGHPVFNDWAVLVASLPIYLWETNNVEAFSNNQVVLVTEVQAIVPLKTDITIGDRLYQIKLRTGATFSNKVYRVESVTRRGMSHLELNLKMLS